MGPSLGDKYEILGRLASGGMANVWLARVRGEAGFEKVVVIKTILPDLAEDPTFTDLFLNEARVAAKLSHPNCVQIYDLGRFNRTYYIAMEFIEGFAFSRLLHRAKVNDRPPSVEVVARISMDVASGLDHAHRLTDRDGTPLSLVHRDVSPDNVLVGFNGLVKLVDFGIVKATDTLQEAVSEGRPKTRTGQVRGKFGYMAPEYLQGKKIDGRADMFALGVVMYRALTGKKPFKGDTDAMVVMAVLQSDPPAPSTFRPDLPPALDQIVLKLLAKDPDARFESCRAVRTAIAQAVRAADTEDVAAYMESLWPPDDAERRALHNPEAAEDSNPKLQSVISESHAVVTVSTPNSAPREATRATRAEGAAGTPSRSAVAPIDPTEPARRRNGVWLAAGALGVALAGGYWVATRPSPAPSAAVSPPAPVEAPVASAAPPEVPAPVPEPPTPAPVKPEPVEPVAVAATPKAAPPVKPPKAPAKATVGQVEVSSTPATDVTLKGKKLGTTPGTFEVPSGPQALVLSNAELGIERTVQVEVTAGQVVKVNQAFAKSTLDVRVSPWGVVRVDGKVLGTTPIVPQELYEGRHVIEITNPDLAKSKRVVVDLAAGEKKVVRESLE